MNIRAKQKLGTQSNRATAKLDRGSDNRNGFAHVFTQKSQDIPERAFQTNSGFATRRFGLRLW